MHQRRLGIVTGDGTTTSVVLAQSIVNDGIRCLSSGANPIGLKKGIDLAVSLAVEELKKVAYPVDLNSNLINDVACISANNDSSCGDIVCKAIRLVGGDGLVNVEESTNDETTIEWNDGMSINSGYISQYFCSLVVRVSALSCLRLTRLMWLPSRPTTTMPRAVHGVTKSWVN